MAYGDIVEYGGKKYCDITPNLTSNTTPAPYVVDWAHVNLNYGQGYYAFDGVPSSAVSFSGKEHDLRFDFGVATEVDCLYVHTAKGLKIQTITWYGMNEGLPYEKLATGTTFDKLYLPLTSTKRFRHYKLFFEYFNSVTISEVRFLKLLKEKYLLYDADTLKTISSNNALIKVDSQDTTANLFEEIGFIEPMQVKNVVEQLTNVFGLLRYSPDNANTSIQITHNTAPQMIIPKSDINVSSYSSIKQITLTTTGTAGAAKVIFSFDGGNSWQTYSNNMWQEIEPTVDVVATSGISPTDVATIPSEAWSVVTGKLRVAYYLAKSTITDDIAIGALTITGDTVSWELANQDDYQCSYPTTVTMQIKLLSDGSYKINYVEQK